MTPEEWASLYEAYMAGKIYIGNTPPKPKIWEEIWTVPVENTGWVLIEAESIEHPTITSYFDHLYAQELGIAYP